MQPFLKWAGGKRWLVQSGRVAFPSQCNRLIEPFLGGGAVFLGLEPPKAIVSDINRELIELYEVIRDRPALLKKLLTWHQDKHSSHHYYKVRSRRYKDRVWRAARTLYLNRTCWNGLYRLNRSGQFNVPIGTKTLVTSAEEEFGLVSKLLSAANIVCQDFEDTINHAGKGDFVFADPPYTVKHNLNGFLKYNEKIFSWDDQLRLHGSLLKAARRGAAIMVTNADHETLRSLYNGPFTYEAIPRQSVLSGHSSGRGATTEAVFSINY